jgi:broad-specificity NMP kinase
LKLIFIYGPPAVGKYTIARELSKMTGYKLFHNHATVDMVMTIFEIGSKSFRELVDQFRLEMLSRAAKEEVNVILTLVYGGAKDDDWIRRVVAAVRRYKGQVLFVRLFSKKNELYKRVENVSRRKFKKIRDRKTFDGVLAQYDVFAEIPFVKSLNIDNSRLSPKTVARQIASYYDLGS